MLLLPLDKNKYIKNILLFTQQGNATQLFKKIAPFFLKNNKTIIILL